ncbi:hypothetical protein GCM10010468_73530 [Actinocorallia longicatena]|uniref:Uncharacterized protein n=1 Tax=Actinocorallia longicatena TaxID=111803 RepID=A0ABP6QM12_9ACTN
MQQLLDQMGGRDAPVEIDRDRDGQGLGQPRQVTVVEARHPPNLAARPDRTAQPGPNAGYRDRDGPRTPSGYPLRVGNGTVNRKIRAKCEKDRDGVRRSP